MKLTLVGSRYFGALVFEALRKDGVDIARVVAPASDDRLAVAAQAATVNLRKLTIWCLTATLALGGLFLVLKGFEYAEDLRKNLWPGSDFGLKAPGTQLFFALYWTLTGVHAIHLSIGMVLIGRLVALGALKRLRLRRNPQVEVTALYWHLVDVIWILLYPLIYLMGRS